jgi:hypothetical protein
MKTDLATESSPLGDYMRHQTAARRRDLAGISIGGKLAGMFVENEVLVNQRDEKTIAFLVHKELQIVAG